jgi:hypothetical protein
MAYGTVSADVIQSSVANTSLGAGNASIMKNRIINGAMVLNQRGASGTITSGNYLVDRFKFFQDTTATLTYTQSTDAPAGFVNSSLITVTSGGTVTTSQGNSFLQYIEGYNIADLNWGTANAKTVTLSFWVKCSVTGTFGGSITNYNNSRSYPYTYTISSTNTWTQVSVTIVGDTSGTWKTDNSAGIIVWFSLGAGSTLSGTAGTWASVNYVNATGATNIVGTSGATFYITGVQLEVGSSATGFEYRQYQQELALCQRYFEILTVTNFPATLISANYGTSSWWVTWYFKQTKRTNPTSAFYNGASWSGTTPATYVSVDNAGFFATSAFYATGTSQSSFAGASAEL